MTVKCKPSDYSLRGWAGRGGERSGGVQEGERGGRHTRTINTHKARLLSFCWQTTPLTAAVPACCSFASTRSIRLFISEEQLNSFCGFEIIVNKNIFFQTASWAKLAMWGRAKITVRSCWTLPDMLFPHLLQWQMVENMSLAEGSHFILSVASADNTGPEMAQSNPLYSSWYVLSVEITLPLLSVVFVGGHD